MDARERCRRYGLRVVCLSCKNLSRHFPESEGPLRDRTCARCGTPGCIRAFWWVKKYPEKATGEVQDALRIHATLNANRL